MNRGREEQKKADTVVMVVSLAGGWTGQQFSAVLKHLGLRAFPIPKMYPEPLHINSYCLIN